MPNFPFFAFMQMPQYYLFYGSLRKGMSLHQRFESDLEYHYSLWLKGYELYALEDYPFAIKSNDPETKILVDVFEIKSQQTVDEIHQIEMAAGYFFEVIKLNDTKAGIYLFENHANEPKVEGGDWVNFYGR
jgi:Uncharacterized conserved protein